MKGAPLLAAYWCLVPFLRKDSGEEELHECPVLLPHEVLAWFVQAGDPTNIELGRATPITHYISPCTCMLFKVLGGPDEI